MALATGHLGSGLRLHPRYLGPIGLVLWTATLWSLLTPGVFAHDSMMSLYEGRTGIFTSNQPPMLGYLWNLLDGLGTGASLLILISAFGLTLGSYLILRRVLSAPLSLAIMMLITIFPPIFTQIGTINKEAIPANLIMLCFAMICYLDDSTARLSIVIVITSAFLAAIAVMIRYQYALVAFVLIILTFISFLLTGKQKRSGYYMRWLMVGSASFVTFLILLVVSINFTDNVDWKAPFAANWRFQLEYDLASLMVNSPPPPQQIIEKLNHDLAVDSGLLASIAKAEYTPSANITLRGFDDLLANTSTQSIANAVSFLEVRNPWGLFYHHAAAYADFLGFGNVCWPVQKQIPSSEPGSPDAWLAKAIHLRSFSQSIASHIIFQSPLLPANTFLFRPLSYIILFLVTSVWLYSERTRRAKFLWLSGLPVSAIAYTLSFAPTTPSCDFRYSYWLVVSSIVFAAVVAVCGMNFAFRRTVLGKRLNEHVRA